MGLFENLRKSVTEIGVLVLVIILISILLVTLKSTNGVCPTGFTYNATANNCYEIANDSVKSSPALIDTIDTAVAAIATPIDYVELILLVVIFVAIIALLVVGFSRNNKTEL